MTSGERMFMNLYMHAYMYYLMTFYGVSMSMCSKEKEIFIFLHFSGSTHLVGKGNMDAGRNLKY